jgi:hypothetical protein
LHKITEPLSASHVTSGVQAPNRLSPWILLAVFAVAFAARATLILGFSSNTDIGPWIDQGAGVALNMLEGRGYTFDYESLPDRRSFRMPGLPVVLYVVWSAVGVNLAAAKLVLAAFGSAACVGVALLGSSLYGQRAGAVSGLTTALYPGLIFWCGSLGPEALVTCFLVFALYPLTWPDGWGKYLWSGASFGLLLLTRPVFGPLAVTVAILPVVRERSSRGFSRGALFVGVIALLFLPWVARNYAVHRELLLTSTDGGSTWLECNNPIAFDERHGDWVIRYIETLPEIQEAIPRLSEMALDRLMFRRGWQNIGNDLQGFGRSVVWRVTHFWSPIPRMDTGFYDWKYAALMLGTWLPVFVAAVVMIVRDRVWRDPRHWPILLTFFWMTVAVALSRSSLRYRTPLEPLFIVYASAIVVQLATGRRQFNCSCPMEDARSSKAARAYRPISKPDLAS